MNIKVSPHTKIIVLRNVSDALRINTMVNSLDPEGFAITSEIDAEYLKHAVDLVLNAQIYWSKTIEEGVNKTNTIGKILDDFDRPILYHLSMGEKTKDISKYVP